MDFVYHDLEQRCSGEIVEMRSVSCTVGFLELQIYQEN